MAANEPAASEAPGAYTGWIVGGLLILAVFGVGAVFWFMHHPFPQLAFHL